MKFGISRVVARTVRGVAECNFAVEFVYVIVRAGVKFRINFMSCRENGNFAVLATMSGIYPKISLLPVLPQINAIASFIKVKISDFQTRFHDE